MSDVNTTVLKRLPLDLQIEIVENAVRKEYNQEERAEIQFRLKQEIECLASRGPRAKGKTASSEAVSASVGRTLEAIGALFGESDTTVLRRLAIYEVAKKEPETFGRTWESVRRGSTSLNYAYGMVKRRVPVETPRFPDGEYDISVFDPPWKHAFGQIGSPEYHVMETLETCRLRPPFAENSVLFLWCTAPTLIHGLTVLREWGFEYKTHMVWVKTGQNGGNRLGIGYWFRGQHELCLVGTKGDSRPPLEENRAPSVLHAPAREHSRKPDELYKLVEKMFPEPGRRFLEGFARGPRPGWTSWGNEANGREAS